MQNRTRTINRLAAAIMRDLQIAKEAYERKGANLETLRALGVQPGEKIGPLPQHKRGPQVPEFVTLVDNLVDAKTGEEVTHAYRSHRFDRFGVEEWTEPKDRNGYSRTRELESVVRRFLRIDDFSDGEIAPLDLVEEARALVEPKKTPRGKQRAEVQAAPTAEAGV